ncbi:MAG: gliding motility lipoprotein GldJ [Bacteroidetes bacterium SW_11_45_7]|nr:MAG: gliding motility lipoprotein GldJ [Bacteroidetes bacterium SW_11_45_7]
MYMRNVIWTVIALFGAALFASCGQEKSDVTGWKYNEPDWGGFEVKDYEGQETGPGLVLVEGGTFVMGRTQENVMYDHDAEPRRVTVSSFYMDETEVANVHYREYLYWLKRVFVDYPQVHRQALPDTLVWREELSYNEPYVDYYLRHPAYNQYPVVGVSWKQANEFCKWRTDRVNEMIMIREGYLKPNPNQVNEDHFDTEAYLAGQYKGKVGEKKEDLNPKSEDEGRRIQMEDGVLLPDYRLPTEAEWEYAALSLRGNQPDNGEERITDRRTYPWDGTSVRYSRHGRWQGDFLANFKRGRGDNMGIAGNLNDNADITASVGSYYPNDFGLYNMAGNVSEWVKDVYRPMSNSDVKDFNPHRGNEFKVQKRNSDGVPVKKDSLGEIPERMMKEEEMADRRNYDRADVRNYRDGDEQSTAEYKFGETSLLNNKARVYKGGSWRDRAYYLSPGTRRYMQQDQATADLGFRCAMDRVGSAGGNNEKAGNEFGKRMNR